MARFTRKKTELKVDKNLKARFGKSSSSIKSKSSRSTRGRAQAPQRKKDDIRFTAAKQSIQLKMPPVSRRKPEAPLARGPRKVDVVQKQDVGVSLVAANSEKSTLQKLLSGENPVLRLSPNELGIGLITGGVFGGGFKTVIAPGAISGFIKKLAGISTKNNSKIVIGKQLQTALSGPAFQLNTKTGGLIKALSEKLVNSVGWKTIVGAGAALFISAKVMELSLGGRIFGSFVGMEEASQTVNIAARDALVRGDLEGYEIAAAARNEVLENPTFWENFKSYIPFVNVADQLENYRSAAITAGSVYDKIARDERIKIESGETDDDKWARVRVEQAAQDKLVVDYYNEQRKLQVQWESEARAAARSAEREADRKAMQAQADFWAKERKKQREKEATDRVAVALFWSDYRKRLNDIQQDSRPSNLNFGLL